MYAILLFLLFILDAVDRILAGILPTLVSHRQHRNQGDEEEGH